MFGFLVCFPKIGIDGCGKETYASLACYIAEHKVHRVPAAHNYVISDFKDMFKNVFIQTGLEGIPTVVMVANLQEEQVSAWCLFDLLKVGVDAPRKVHTYVCEFSIMEPFQPSVIIQL